MKIPATAVFLCASATLAGCATDASKATPLALQCSESPQTLSRTAVGDLTALVRRQCGVFAVELDNRDSQWDYRCAVTAGAGNRSLSVAAGKSVVEVIGRDALPAPTLAGCQIQLSSTSDKGQFERIDAHWLTGEVKGKPVLLVVNSSDSHLRCNLFDAAERPVGYVFGVPRGGSTARYDEDIAGWKSIACGAL